MQFNFHATKVTLSPRKAMLPNKILYLCTRQTKECEYEPNKRGIGG